MTQTSYLTGHFLIALPSMPDPRFSKSVIFVCAHNADGAMGLVINRLFDPVDFSELLNQLSIPITPQCRNIPVHFGGPVESGRGFVLHSSDYNCEGTLVVNEGVSLTATLDILKALAEGKGPKQCILALGYAGWAAGQLDAELQTDGWLHAEGSTELLFDPQVENKWDKILAHIGVNPSMLSTQSGHA